MDGLFELIMYVILLGGLYAIVSAMFGASWAWVLF